MCAVIVSLVASIVVVPKVLAVGGAPKCRPRRAALSGPHPGAAAGRRHSSPCRTESRGRNRRSARPSPYLHDAASRGGQRGTGRSSQGPPPSRTNPSVSALSVARLRHAAQTGVPPETEPTLPGARERAGRTPCERPVAQHLPPLWCTIGRVRGAHRVFCTPECRRVFRNELRAYRHELDDARAQLAFYRRQALDPLPGVATPRHALRDVVRWEAVVARDENDIRQLLKGPSDD